jgi:hypothetical protein
MGQDYSELRARIAALGMTQSSLARTMKELGDDRDEKNILRSIQRMAAGDARVSGEMRALLGLMERSGMTSRGATETQDSEEAT